MHIIIDKNSSDQRLDRFLRKYFKHTPEVKLGDIFSWLRKGAIKVNKRKHKENYRLQIGDEIIWDDSITTDKDASYTQKTKQDKVRTFPLSDIQHMIIHEDNHWIVFNKPVDLVMHPGAKHGHDMSLHDIMKSYFLQTDQELATSTFHPSFCFRLDKDTSGIVIAAKSYEALQLLNEIIRLRQSSKQYIAILQGHLKEKTTVDVPLFKGFDKKSGRGKTFVNKEKGVEARSDFIPFMHIAHEHLGDITLVRIKIHTGRMHQIRVHAAHIHHPVIGDITYGNAPLNRIAHKKGGVTRQLLHSRKYGFSDSIQNKQLIFTAPLPDIFTDLFPSAAGAITS